MQSISKVNYWEDTRDQQYMLTPRERADLRAKYNKCAQPCLIVTEDGEFSQDLLKNVPSSRLIKCCVIVFSKERNTYEMRLPGHKDRWTEVPILDPIVPTETRAIAIASSDSSIVQFTIGEYPLMISSHFVFITVDSMVLLVTDPCTTTEGYLE